MVAINNPDVAEVFNRYPKPIRENLMFLRRSHMPMLGAQ